MLLVFSAGSRADAWSESYKLEAAGKYDNAAQLFDPLLKQAPGNEFARLRRAWLHYLAGDYNDSQSDYKKALQANPRSLDAQIGLTLPLLAQQRWKEAGIIARQALEVAPWNYYAHLRLLVAEEGQQQWQTVRDHADRLHERYPSDATILVYRARAHYWLGDMKVPGKTTCRCCSAFPGISRRSSFWRASPDCCGCGAGADRRVADGRQQRRYRAHDEQELQQLQPALDQRCGSGGVPRALKRAGGEGPATGIFTRDMSTSGNPIVPVAMRGGEVPAPNTVTSPGPATFNEFPSFPRIDANSGTLAFRGQSTPSVLTILPDGSETRSGTSGVYATPIGNTLITGVRNVLPNDYPQFLVPDQAKPTKFDQFPGGPSPDGNIITFKGNWTDSEGVAQTGVYFRDIVADSGTSPVVKLAERGDAIPTEAVPGGGSADVRIDRAAPTALTTVAGFQTVVPNNGTNTLSAFGEGLSFDGRYVGFWGGWGTETFARQVQCATDGNAIVRQACVDQDSNGVAGDGMLQLRRSREPGHLPGRHGSEQTFPCGADRGPLRRLPVLELLGQCGPGRWRRFG